MRHALIHGALASAVACVAVMPANGAAPPTKPNIVFILADDLGWRDLHCYGSNFYETPNLDRLAARGVLFTDAYAAGPVCSPTRASLLTGYYPIRTGITGLCGKGRPFGAPSLEHLPLGTGTVAENLRANGYETWHVGKWHVGEDGHFPEQQGFDVAIGYHDAGQIESYFAPYHLYNLAQGPTGEYISDRLTDEAIELIRHRKQDKRFFLNLWHYAPHVPLEAPAPLVAHFKAKAKAMGLDKQPAFAPSHAVRRRIVQSDPVYAAMISNLDWNIGRLLKALDETGESQNTLVVFTSDNGGLSGAYGSPTCNAPLSEGKGWLYEGGLREPMIAYWPSITPTKTICTVPVTSPDIYTTFLNAAGVQQAQPRDGVDLMPLLRGGQKLNREAIYWYFPHFAAAGGVPSAAIRVGQWKLIEFNVGYGNCELYNLQTDISEQHDLSQAEPAITQQLRKQLHDWRSQEIRLRPDTVRAALAQDHVTR